MSRGVAATTLAPLPAEWIVPAWNASSQVHAFTTTRAAPDGSDGFDARIAATGHSPAPAAHAGRNCVAAGPAGATLTRFLPSATVWLAQVHGAAVFTVNAGNLAKARASAPRADALVTTLANVPLAVRHADCLPVLLASTDGRVIAVAHAGWRGLSAGIIEAAVAAMQATDIVAWLGPAIGPSAFEVGADVVEAFCAQHPEAKAAFMDTRPGKWHADLYLLARQRLAACGVHQVTGGDACTLLEPQRFFSHRRDADPRRMASVIYRS